MPAQPIEVVFRNVDPSRFARITLASDISVTGALSPTGSKSTETPREPEAPAAATESPF